MKKKIVSLVLGLCIIGGTANIAGPVDAATASSLRISGTVSGLDRTAGNAVMLLAYDGSSVRASVSADGKFTVAVPKKIVARFSTKKRGRGASLHILKNGEYVGPVMLSKKTTKLGYMTLSPSLKGVVKLGKFKMKANYAAGTVATKFLDTSATVRLRKSMPVGALSQSSNMLMTIVRATSSIKKSVGTLGADADRDGLPNVADEDMNGDGLLDAAQPESLNDFEGLQQQQVLAGRPTSKINLVKILNLETAIQTNSNANPSVTLEQVREALAAGLSIEIGLPVSSTDLSQTSVLIDCRKLSFCELGSSAVVRAAPGDPNDGKKLSDFQNSEGLIVIPQRAGESTFMLRFYPGVASAANGNLAGDVFELITRFAGQTVASEAKVVTSSVATPMALMSLDGQRITFARGISPVSVSSTTAMKLDFYRPQAFADDGSERLIDRGGLTYFYSIWPDDGSNTGYFCQSKHVDGLSSSLLRSPATLPPVEQGIFDGNLAPSNGELLSMTLNAQQCLADQQNKRHSFVSGSKWRLEVEAQDSDGNKVRTNVPFFVP